jgi:hypothetical protein
MKAIYIGKLYRDADHKFVPGQEYDLSAKEIEKHKGKFEIVTEKKSKAEVKTDGNS